MSFQPFDGRFETSLNERVVIDASFARRSALANQAFELGETSRQALSEPLARTVRDDPGRADLDPHRPSFSEDDYFVLKNAFAIWLPSAAVMTAR
jgi:hypothetical protein